MAVELIIGAPVTQRAWVLPTWLERMRAQVRPQTAGLMFVYGAPLQVEPDDTLEILASEENRGFWRFVEVLHDREDDHYPKRVWNLERYQTMARLRNLLLAEVRDLSPAWYFSCDTDVLLPDGAIETLIQVAADQGFHGVAPLMYMTPHGTGFPNAMNHGWVTRPDVNRDEPFQVDACFGAVLMNRSLYQVDYVANAVGEDLGWANDVIEAGLRLGLDPRVKAKHVMRPEALQQLDERVGW